MERIENFKNDVVEFNSGNNVFGGGNCWVECSESTYQDGCSDTYHQVSADPEDGGDFILSYTTIEDCIDTR